jgi:ATP phosphoribosyltransferase
MLELNKPLLLALPKGRFLEYSRGLIRNLFDSDATFDESLDRVTIHKNGSQCFFLKPPDIPYLLVNKRIDIGIAPKEWCLEQRLSECQGIRLVKDALDKLKIKLCFFSDTGTWPDVNSLRVVTSFPNIVESYLNSNDLIKTRYKSVEIIPMKGSIEAMVSSVAHVGFDCVETGSSIDSHNLAVIETYMESLDLQVWCLNESFEYASKIFN